LFSPANIALGDFSFARSLAKQYKCRKLYATCYDSQETLFTKYPQTEQIIKEILDSSKPKSKSKSADAEEDKTSESNAQATSSTSTSTTQKPSPKVLFSVDARKLGTPAGGGKEIRTGYPRKEPKIPAWKLHQQSQGQAQGKYTPAASPPSGPWDVICFNFPHVGGLSTDVNRQVRANQELLVAFFKACVPLLSTAPPPVDEDDEWEEDSEEDSNSDSEANEDGDGENDAHTSGKATRTGPGQILVSLFEGEPYTLWNIKDLARHAGLQVVTSFKFPWAEYEGYSHARTLGEVEGKDGGRGGWRGEDRLARMYVFEVKQEEAKGKKKKRAREGDSDSE
jgi:25S rRNA (uracil2634-N3)-methyltransferase